MGGGASAPQPAHERPQEGEFLVQLFGSVPVITVQHHTAGAVELHQRRAVDALLHLGAPASQAEVELPDQEGLGALRQLQADDEARLVQRVEHVGEHLANGRHAAHFVERVLEQRVGRIQVAQGGQALGGQVLVELGQARQGAIRVQRERGLGIHRVHNPVTRRTSAKYQR